MVDTESVVIANLRQLQKLRPSYLAQQRVPTRREWSRHNTTVIIVLLGIIQLV